MASAESIAELRLKIAEHDETTYTDQMLSDRIDAAVGDVNKVAHDIWQEKAATYSELVDITEAGSSRKMSQLYSNALKMAQYFGSIDNDDTTGPVVERPTTRPIVRA